MQIFSLQNQVVEIPALKEKIETLLLQEKENFPEEESQKDKEFKDKVILFSILTSHIYFL